MTLPDGTSYQGEWIKVSVKREREREKKQTLSDDCDLSWALRSGATAQHLERNYLPTESPLTRRLRRWSVARHARPLPVREWTPVHWAAYVRWHFG